MFGRYIKCVMLLGALLAFVVGCGFIGTSNSPTPTQAVATAPDVGTTAPDVGTTAPDVGTTPTGTTAASSGRRTVKNVVPGQVYKLQVMPEQTQVSYAVHEVLLGNSRITVGTTNAAEGDFGVVERDGKPFFSFSTFRVDLRTLTSDNRMRDEAIRRQWLESNKYPYATFVAKDVTEYPSDAAEGQEVHGKVTGDLTIRDITHAVTWDVVAKGEGDTLTGTGTTLIYMKDFGFDPPNILGRFQVTDGVTLTVKGVAKLVEGTFQ
jgi:polyisoprenoid-binding protein YceI